MGKKGQHIYKGVNAQAWAAMSLFLQYLRYADFSYIQLEAPEFEDFNLVFNDGHKIICESKNWEREFNFSYLKKILDNILKKKIIGERDEILIICTKLNRDLKSKVENMKYWSQFIAPEFKKKKFSDQQIAILDRVKFWKVQEADNHLIVYALFSELLDFWLPEDELECRADSILIERIYAGSAKGEIYKREDIINEIKSIRKKASKYSGYFDNERVKIETQLQNLIKAVDNNKSPEWAPNQLSALSSKPALMFFALDCIKDKKIGHLKDWGDLWGLYKIYRFSFSLFKIFENNLHTGENKKYILQFFKNNISEARRFYQHDFFDVDVVKITKQILTQDKRGRYLEDAFEIIKELITERRDNIFYLKVQQDSSWERGEIAKLLKEVDEKASAELKDKIYKLIVDTFNLIKDEGEFSHYTPREIFEILKGWLVNDFKNRLKAIANRLISQYQKLYGKHKGKEVFRGWELSGGGTSFWGHDYRVQDRHFILFALKPTLEDYYKGNPQKAWQFIKEDFITPTEEVSKKRPDFLNRASIPIILERYKNQNEKISKEAFEILKEFILSRRGIPHKSDLIYQAIREDFPDDKKWELLRVSIEKYKLPVNPFAEQIALELAKKGKQEAKNVLKEWIRNPDYYSSRIFERNVAGIISQFLDFSFNEGVEMFKDFITQDYFIKGFDLSETFEISHLLNKILNKNFKTGLEILNTLSRKPELSDNEQIVLFSGLNYKIEGRQVDEGTLSKIYSKFLDPFLGSFDNDVERIEQKITRSQSREEIVEFASVLAKHQKISEAMRILRIFINDSDPCTPEKVNSKDLEGKYDEHRKIEQGEDTHAIITVRGRCAWELMNFVVPTGRKYIEEIIDLTEKLTKDKNYYVQLMSCFPLSQLARNRLTVMPENKKELFFNKDIKKALEMAKKVEKIAFRLLEKFSKLDFKPRDVLMNALFRVFDDIRGLNQENADRLLKEIAKCGEKVISEAAPLFIYFAEFRQKDFKDWKLQLSGLYDDLEDFDNKPFQQILENILKRGSPEINSKFAWHFWKLVKESVPDKTDIKNVVKYNKAFEISNRYLNVLVESYDHQTFENVYYFIQENIDQCFKECYKLWQKCLEKEKVVIKGLVKEGKVYEASWWPFYHNGEILMIVKQKGSDREFLESLEFLLDYPKEANVGDMGNVLEALQDLPTEYDDRVEEVFNKLIERNPHYYKTKENWKKKIRSSG